jgi:tRNA nucleotidyltransferase/poly(A) polymerase
MDGKEYEIATFRDEYYDPDKGDGRHPTKVVYSSPGWDAARRDLTFNALFYSLKAKEIRDYNLNAEGRGQGFDDIKNLVVRPVGDAALRFREDKLRIPRLVRFHSRFSSGSVLESLDAQTVEAVRKFRDLKGVSAERIVNEFSAGLSKAMSPIAYVKNYEALGLMPAVFPKLKVDLHDVECLGNCRNPKAVLAWLLKGNEDIRKKLNDLKYANDVSDRVNFLVKLLKGATSFRF